MRKIKHILKQVGCSCMITALVATNLTPALAAENSSIAAKNTLYTEKDDQNPAPLESALDIEGKVYVEYLNEFARGKNPPTGTSYIDLSKNDLTCYCEKITVRLYSNSFFSGVKKIKVNIPEINVDKNGMSNKSGPVKVHVRKKNSNVDLTQSISVDGGSVYFSGLDPNALYYLEFEKANDSQIYSFSAYITESN